MLRMKFSKFSSQIVSIDQTLNSIEMELVLSGAIDFSICWASCLAFFVYPLE